MIRFSSTLLFVVFALVLFSQSRTNLEKERMRIIDKIEFTSGILKKTEKDKSVSLDYLRTLQSQIANRKKIINNINNQIEKINKEILEKQSAFDTLVETKQKIRTNFFNLLQVSYIKSITKNDFIFLLSASDWENFLDRKRYLKQINKHTEKRLDEIIAKEKEIQGLLNEIKEDKKELEKLLVEEKENIEKLKIESKKKDEIIRKLKKNERKLLAILKNQKREREKLNRSIEDIIINQLKTGNSGYSDAKLNKLSNSFEDNKSLLDWPVYGGFISSRFGKHKHPTIKGVVTFKNGIDIRTSPYAVVKSVFDGEVVGLRLMTANNWMMIIKHGEYYTVYSKLENANVSKNDIVKRGQIIGKISESGIFHFELWHKKTKLNPEQWLRKNGY